MSRRRPVEGPHQPLAALVREAAQRRCRTRRASCRSRSGCIVGFKYSMKNVVQDLERHQRDDALHPGICASAHIAHVRVRQHVSSVDALDSAGIECAAGVRSGCVASRARHAERSHTCSRHLCRAAKIAPNSPARTPMRLDRQSKASSGVNVPCAGMVWLTWFVLDQ